MQGAEVAQTAYLKLENSRVMCELARKLVQMRAVMHAVPPPKRSDSLWTRKLTIMPSTHENGAG